MAQIAGKYVFSEGENIAEFLVSLGLPEEYAKHINQEVNNDVEVNGNKYTLTTTIKGRTIVVNLELGKDVEHTTTTGKVVKNHATLAGDVLTIDSKLPDGKTAQRRLTFSDSGIVETLCSQMAKQKRELCSRELESF